MFIKVALFFTIEGGFLGRASGVFKVSSLKSSEETDLSESELSVEDEESLEMMSSGFSGFTSDDEIRKGVWEAIEDLLLFRR